MSWAMRRRILYVLGVMLFLGVIIGVPLAIILHKDPTCSDGITNQGETSADHGGPCLILDASSITPTAVLLTRSFRVRDGTYASIVYIENPNSGAGVEKVKFRIGLYDSENVLVAERIDTTSIIPGGITPIFEGGIDTGERFATHTIFQLLEQPVWQRMKNVAGAVTVTRDPVIDTDTMPRLNAKVQNTSVSDIQDLEFVAVLFDPAGNAFAASQTALDRLNASERKDIVFTWPTPFETAVGRVDVFPVHTPVIAPLTANAR
jgi:hypothetical protein